MIYDTHDGGQLYVIFLL